MAGKVSVSPQSTDLGSRMNAAKEAGGGIVPGANAVVTPPIGNPIQQIGKMIHMMTQKRVGGVPHP